jgi:5-methylcytosine-specific restriction enzyme subunit McrC
MPERALVSVFLREWESVGPTETLGLKGTSLRDNLAAQRLVDQLRSRVDIREGYQGLEITSTSFVGRVDVGSLRIAIQPKLPALPLTTLMRYAYGLRDLGIIEETSTPTCLHGLHDLLIIMLVAEVEELLHRGLARRYIPVIEKLESPRGRVLFEKIMWNGGITEPRLPCQHFERRVNWQLNQVLRSGLDVAAWMTEDRDLRRRVQRLAGMFEDVERKNRLDVRDIDQAERQLTRLTEASSPALTIIRLLHDMRGVAFDDIGESSATPGYLFDMNQFFQNLLSRFLHENLIDQHIVDEKRLVNVFSYAPEANPKRRSAPKPRPDFALFHADKPRGFLDAKYRDIWEKGLPSDWLYQLSIYALASPIQVSVLLYATMAEDACDERINIRQPIPWSSDPVFVILRPVSLPKLARLIDHSRHGKLATERLQFAKDLVVFNARMSKAKAREVVPLPETAG